MAVYVIHKLLQLLLITILLYVNSYEAAGLIQNTQFEISFKETTADEIVKWLRTYDFTDPESIAKFRASLPQLNTPNDLAVVSHKDGYICHLPTESIRRTESRKKIDSVQVAHVVSEGFKLMPCVNKRTELWTYEICHDRYIRRFLTKGKGKEIKAQLLAEGGPRSISLAPIDSVTYSYPMFFEEIYEGYCTDRDTDPHRTAFVTVKYECDSKVTRIGKYIIDIKDNGPCDFHLTVKMGILCEIPAFVVGKLKDESEEIVCEHVFLPKEIDKIIHTLENVQQEERNTLKKNTKYREDLKQHMIAIQRLRAAMWHTQLLRAEKKYLATENKLRVIWIGLLWDYVQSSLFDYGKTLDPNDNRVLGAVGMLFDTRDLYIQEFGNDWKDIDRGIFWYYMHSRWWHKGDYPHGLHGVDMTNGYDTHTIETLYREVGIEDIDKLDIEALRMDMFPYLLQNWLAPSLSKKMRFYQQLFTVVMPFEMFFDSQDNFKFHIEEGVDWFLEEIGELKPRIVRRYAEYDKILKKDKIILPFESRRRIRFFCQIVAPVYTYIRDEIFPKNYWITWEGYEELRETMYSIVMAIYRQSVILDFKHIIPSVVQPDVKDKNFKLRGLRNIWHQTSAALRGRLDYGLDDEAEKFDVKLKRLQWESQMDEFRNISRRKREQMMSKMIDPILLERRWQVFEETLKDKTMTGMPLVSRAVQLVDAFPVQGKEELEEIMVNIIEGAGGVTDELLDDIQTNLFGSLSSTLGDIEIEEEDMDELLENLKKMFAEEEEAEEE